MQSLATARSWKIDLLKCIAIFDVVCSHTCILGLSNPPGSFDWTASILWGSVGRTSVSLFLMCSGALLLSPKKELSVKKLYSKNMLRLLAALLFWAMAYQVFRLGIDHALSPATLLQAAKDVLLFHHETHLYYLHIMLLVYAFLPLTRLVIQHATRRQIEYALALWFVLGILYPTLKPFWPLTLLRGIPVQWGMNMAYASIGYGVLGYYLSTYPLPSRPVRLSCLFLGFLTTFGGTLAFSLRQGGLYEHLWEGMSLGVCLLAVGIYTGVTAWQKEPSPRVRAVLAECSKGTFCVYLVHVFVISLFAHLGFTVAILPCLVSIPLVIGANLICSGGIYLVLSKIPVVNRWLI
ncbi:MAG: acyltransferase [Oscillibacter sp.]